MANSATPSGRVTFQFSFREDSPNRQTPIGQFSSLDVGVHFKECGQNVRVRVERTFRNGLEHVISFYARSKASTSESDWKKSDYVRLSVARASSLSLTVSLRDGAGAPRLAEAATGDQAIPIERTTLEAGETYRIQLVNKPTGLCARIIKLVNQETGVGAPCIGKEQTPAASADSAEALLRDLRGLMHRGAELVGERIQQSPLAQQVRASLLNQPATFPAAAPGSVPDSLRRLAEQSSCNQQ